MLHLEMMVGNITAVVFPFILVFIVSIFTDHMINAIKQVIIR